MNIGKVADTTGLPAKTIRFYEDEGLVTPLRQDNGYRVYQDNDVHKLRFLQRSRSLGFSLDDCRRLLSLYDDPERNSADVKAIARQHLAEVERKIEELYGLAATLKHLVKACRGDNRPDCPIIKDLAKPQRRQKS